MATKRYSKYSRRRQSSGSSQFSRLNAINRYSRGRRGDDGGSSSDEILAGGPGSYDRDTEEESERATRKPLGVPRDYRVPSVVTQRGPVSADAAARRAELGQRAPYGAEPGTIVQRGPRYFDGDQWKPASKSGTTVRQLQMAMANAGLLGDFQLGVWDSRSADAYAEVLSFANAAGITDQMALQQMVENPNIEMGGLGAGSSGGGGSGRRIIGFDDEGNPIFSEYVPPPLEIRTTNKEDLKNLFRSVTADKLGIGWTDAQLQELVDAYNWQEIRVARSNYDQQVALERTAFNEGPEAVAGQTAMIEEAPDPEGFIQSELIKRDPTGYQASQFGLSAVDMFTEALSKWSI